MAPLPLLKLFALLVKTLAKPVANRIKVEVRRHPKFSELCISIGQMTHQVTSRLNVMASGYKILQVEPLATDEALARGINFVSESFIFGVAGGILVFEYQRGEAKTTAKALQAEEEKRRYEEYLDDKFQNLYREIKTISTRLDDIESRIEEQEKQRSRWLLGLGSVGGTSSRSSSGNSSNSNSNSIDRKDFKQVLSMDSAVPSQNSIKNEPSNSFNSITNDAHISTSSPPAMMDESEMEAPSISITKVDDKRSSSDDIHENESKVVPSDSRGYWWYRWRLW